jgi:hypothetical protein
MNQSSAITFPPALVSIEVLGDRGLRLVVEELPAFGAPADDRHELVWEVVVGFLVRGDPFPNSGPSRVTVSNLGAATAFLDMVRTNSHAEPDYIAAMHGGLPVATELRHWQVSTTDALIDVAATYAPTSRRLPREVR